MRRILVIITFKYKSFNPRIRKGCDFIMFRSFDGVPVSIHASVKDATPLNDFFVRKTAVSIHASVKDATDTPKG